MYERSTLNPYPIPILTYHQIAPTPPKGTPYRSLVVAPENFERQMRFLKKLGFQGLSMADLLPYLRGKKTGRVVGITFDDGYQNNFDNALPVLESVGFSSTCYVVSGLIGKTNAWDLAVGIPQTPLMSEDVLRKWVAAGQDIGAHTRNHARLSSASPMELDSEVRGCKVDLEDLFGQEISHFCYPYGDYSEASVNAVREAGFLSATTTSAGRVHAHSPWWTLNRVSVVRRTSRLGLLLKVLRR